ncbi:NAD+ synthase [Novosphingobium sp. FGD1]|jgi:NAD+ synthase|uniref:Glutamine-dependent NAD(+) synthetase n=1 Tax=Novosphingobium silvae TaxID=2692619 RepID=A0A7X4K5U4_9SPHN|nr:NAD+ synthase [Novosphingobium silvae]MYL96247.1 NAD+ synthase [Novosphingobium silvae]
MPDTLKITLAQLNQSVGDIPGNAAGVLAAREQAKGSDLVVFPELHLVGYPPEDLVLKPALIERAAAQLQQLAEASASEGPAMLVGSAFILDGALHNGVALLDQGKVAAVRLKHELPNYGTLDEMRLFQPGPLPEPVILRGTMIGVPVGEDLWRVEVCRHLADFGAEILVSINGSPYEMNKDALRIEGVAKRRAVDTGLPLAYLNRVGGQDELVFDGASFVVNGDGSLAAQLRDWEEQVFETRWTKTVRGWRCDRGTVEALAAHPEDIYCAMVLALRDYVNRGGFRGALLALDGGVASAACAAIAVDALGPERVRAVMMPSRSTAGAALEDAAACASALGIRCAPMPIDAALESMDAMLGQEDGDVPSSRTEEEPERQLRAAALAILAGRRGSLLVTSSDKSDLGTGDAALCAGAAAYNPLKDAYASTVAALASWRNGHVPRIGLGPAGAVIPQATLLRGRRDTARGGPYGSGRLPEGEMLDAILVGLVENDKSVGQLVQEGFARETVRAVEDLLHSAEYRRRQSAPGVKLTSRNFGRDRRYPITHAFRSE